MEAGGRIRLICVYTAQTNPINILNDIKGRISEDLDLPISGNKKDLACTVDDKIRIVVFNKLEATVFNKKAKVVPFHELPQRALKEFSALVEGLIPCAALHSIAAVRELPPGLLALMNKSLDGAFCAHRTLIPDTDDSIDFILNLISQEVSTKILGDEAARNSLDTAAIKSWYDGQALPQNQYALEKKTLWQFLKIGGANLSDVRIQQAKAWLRKKRESNNQLKDKEGNNISYSDAEAIIEEGLFQKIQGCSPPSEKKPDTFAELFYQNQAKSKQACNEISRLTCSSKDESDLRKNTDNGLFLTLGSVLRVMNKDTDYYILCLQPPCDCVRLKEKTFFFFLQLYNGSAGNVDFVIKLHDGTYQALSIRTPNKKPRFKSFIFSPDKGSGRILIRKLNKRRYKWVAELRPEKAQTIAQKVMTNASRIGLDEFEILRRKGSQL